MAFSLFDAVIFQSKPSVGRATPRSVVVGISSRFQSKPSVGRATFRLQSFSQVRPIISIHALRGEGDLPTV